MIFNLNSLIAQVLKTKYFPNLNFLRFGLKLRASYTWRNIWVTKKTLLDGLRWKVERGDKVLIREDAWILEPFNCKIVHPVSDDALVLVADLIDNNTRLWKEDKIFAIFHVEDAESIVCIPLERRPQEEELV